MIRRLLVIVLVGAGVVAGMAVGRAGPGASAHGGAGPGAMVHVGAGPGSSVLPGALPGRTVLPGAGGAPAGTAAPAGAPPALEYGAAGPTSAARELEPRFGWPLSPRPVVARPFQAPSGPYGPGHRGVDLAATPGQQVLAAGPGVVVFAGTVASRGVVSIDHDGGLRTTYEPVTPTVPAGTQVWQGQPIGLVEPGHPGCPVEACLHWGVRRGEEYLNPLPLIRTESVIRLKPWTG